MADDVPVAARTDSMITDPVCEVGVFLKVQVESTDSSQGKSMAGMIQMIREGSIAPGSKVLYLHLGGQPALAAYSSYFPHD